MILSKQNIQNIDPGGVSLPHESYFHLPEKVLQFGTGVLLRGLPDYFIDKANKQHIFNGRIVVVKSTAGGDTDAFLKQDGLYTQCLRGTANGNEVSENIVNASISRVLSAKSDWQSILACAANPDLELIISNTTEVGIRLQADDDIRSNPPDSFPGKLLAILYERFKVFNGAKDKGLVIVPTELIPQNGTLLESIIEELAHLNKLDYTFIDWLENCNHFCNSLVDRIVPGRMPVHMQSGIEAALGYKDDLMIISEPYKLWAIEGNSAIAQKLSFAKADEGVIITTDIEKYKELKIRILNGSHTLTCGLAFLAGFHTVKDAMNDDRFATLISRLVYEEIIPSIGSASVTEEEARKFAASVLERYTNAYIDHQWLNITMQYTSKMGVRIVPLLKNYYQRFNTVPQKTAIGIAAYILFMHSEKDGTGKYWGKLNERNYLVTDDSAALISEKWNHYSGLALVKNVLGDTSLWGSDLNELEGLSQAVNEYMETIQQSGATAVLDKCAALAIAV